MKKGQIVMTDLFLAVTIFIITIMAIIFLYTSFSNRLNDEVNYKDMMIKAFDISNSLLSHGGSPTNWNTTNVKVMGLAESDHILSTEKIQNFANLSYNASKRLLGMGTYEYFIQIRDLENQNLMQVGAPPEEDIICNTTYQAVTLRRFALWQNNKVNIRLTVWDDNCLRTEGLNLITL